MSTVIEELFFSCADYATWNQIAFITLEEFIYLINGLDPLGTRLHDKEISANDLVGYEQVFIDFSESKLEDFNCSWKKITLLGRELPIQSDTQTEVRYLKDKLPRYEAVFLVQWAKSKNIPINSHYSPVETQERRNNRFIQDYIGRPALFRDEFIEILVTYNQGKDKTYFKTRLLDAIELQELRSIPLPFDYTVPFDQRNFKFKTQTLIEYAQQMKWNFPEELKPELNTNVRAETSLRSHFKDGNIMVDGIIDVRQIESTKLVLALENYITNMRQDSKRIPSTDSVKQELVSKYGKDGVSETMARTIDECSRHDLKSKNPPKSAREKTIFFQ